MEFPATPAEFIEDYAFRDKEEVYTNGSLLIPVFRVEQMVEHYFSKHTCRMTYDEEWSGDEYYPTEVYRCSECGGITETGCPNFCPSCGAKAVG